MVPPCLCNVNLLTGWLHRLYTGKLPVPSVGDHRGLYDLCFLGIRSLPSYLKEIKKSDFADWLFKSCVLHWPQNKIFNIFCIFVNLGDGLIPPTPSVQIISLLNGGFPPGLWVPVVVSAVQLSVGELFFWARLAWLQVGVLWCEFQCRANMLYTFVNYWLLSEWAFKRSLLPILSSDLFPMTDFLPTWEVWSVSQTRTWYPVALCRFHTQLPSSLLPLDFSKGRPWKEGGKQRDSSAVSTDFGLRQFAAGSQCTTLPGVLYSLRLAPWLCLSMLILVLIEKEIWSQSFMEW